MKINTKRIMRVTREMDMTLSQFLFLNFTKFDLKLRE